MTTREETTEMVEERRARIIEFMSKRDRERLGMTGAVVHARLAYLFVDARRCNADLAALQAQGRLRRTGVSGTRWVVVDGVPVPTFREAEMTPDRRSVLDVVALDGSRTAINGAAELAGLTSSQLDHHLSVLVRAGLIERVAVGMYRLTAAEVRS